MASASRISRGVSCSGGFRFISLYNTMLSLTVQIEDTARETLAALMSRLENAEAIHEAMGEGVQFAVREHIRTTKKSPNTNWWGDAADGVVHSASASEAVVSVTKRGAALRYYGGTVKRREGGPHLAIPSDAVPVRDNTRLAPREMGPLHYLPPRRGAKSGVAGYFVEGELTGKTIQSGKRAGEPATKAKPGGSLLYTLMAEVTHRPDPSVLPSQAELLAAAAEAAADVVFALGD